MKLWLFLIFSFLYSVSSVSAAGDFYVKQIAEYKYDETGRSSVTQHISLTNNYSDLFPNRYKMKLTGEKMAEIKAHDNHGTLKTIEENGDLIVDLPRSIAGVGKTTNFTLQYTATPATHRGQVWEIMLPKLGNPELVDDFQVFLTVPANFSKPAYVSPEYVFRNGVYIFDKKSLLANGVTAAFGNFQTYKFALTYQLQNSTAKTQLLAIPWPADSLYQQIYYTQASPTPHNVRVDDQGDWQADYLLKPDQILQIKIEGLANISPGPASTNRVAKDIYNFVIKNLNYDTQTRCLEFTKLFIDRATKAGMKARMVVGYAYTTQVELMPVELEGKALHAWPEYWDESKKIWIGVDPTWGETTGGIDYFSKLDFYHLAIGHDPKMKIIDAKMEMTGYKEILPVPLTVTWNKPWISWPFIKNAASITKRNSSGQMVEGVPPFGRLDIPYEYSWP